MTAVDSVAGTPGTLIDLFLRHPNNNFLHAQVYAFVRNALDNRVYRTQYAQHVRIPRRRPWSTLSRAG